MNRFAIWSTVMSVAMSATAVGQQQPTPKQKQDAKVWEAIGDLVVKRDDMHRYLMVGQGEVVQHTGVEVFGSVVVKLADRKRGYDLTACVTYPPGRRELLGCYIYDGDQEYTFRNLQQTKPTTRPTVEELKTKPWLANFEDFKKFKAPGSLPYDAAICGTFMSRNRPNPQFLETYVLNQYRLVETEASIGGRFIAKFEWESPVKLLFKYDVEFSSAHDMLPVRVDGTGTSERGKFTTNARYEWKRGNRQFLLFRGRWAQEQDLSSKDRSGRTRRTKFAEEMAYVYEWFLDDQVPEELFDASNPVAAVLERFNIPYSGADNTPVEYVPPANLHATGK